ncbi:MAG: hypothetical protein QF921_09300 [Pseudomonadales bacterium]|nr:hypothetical protein [Pseudomonadales bacterium]MDP6472393.1 hypothetical protein [Pseudomonadales bacterium]MDP6828189.1 hypothetical protein [Pseudomonadales bacterium]MDP6971688.1 hypothetical protein [Pseudomonadales bacterium]
MPEANETYRDSILAAWAGEVLGEVFFDRLATLDGTSAPKWRVLQSLEAATRDVLAPLMMAHGGSISPPDAGAVIHTRARANDFAALPHRERL